MEKTALQSHPPRAGVLARGPWILAAAGTVLFHLAWVWQGTETGLWLPGLGLGIVLVSWLGWAIVPVLALDLFLVRWLTSIDTPFAVLLADTAIHSLLMGVSWQLYHHVARGSQWLDDPRSATTFLILVPGGLAAAAAVAQALVWIALQATQETLWILAAELWLSSITGILIVVPFLIVAGTPIVLRYRLLDFEIPAAFLGERDEAETRFGQRMELAALTFATTVLALLLVWIHLRGQLTTWMLWATCLVLIVWTCIRQGLRGGCVCAGVTSFAVLIAAEAFGELPAGAKTSIQGNLLAFCSTALLVGVSASWIRANETRYRLVVSRIPFVVYSVRLPYGLPAQDSPETKRPEVKIDLHAGPSISRLANVVLVSPACKQVFGCEIDDLIGPFAHWMDRIAKEDQELVIAALTQLCLQKQPVTCEYRLNGAPETAKKGADAMRWVRDTLTPHYCEEGMMDGWEGLVEDITEQRGLSQSLRKTTGMLQVLVSNLPTGVYFVQAPHGFPILVNARARQLLGRREDLSSGVEQIPKVFHLHRPDGSEYPWDELPVAKALRLGVASRANDIVLHRPDGRKVPLITWGAPVDLQGKGTPDAAVWVLEDWSAMQQAEMALRESELRLRVVIETIAEGVIVQDVNGAVIDSNAAACSLLGVTRERLLTRIGLADRGECRREDGSPMPLDQQPDWQALRTSQAVRGIVVGLAIAADTRWLLVNSLPLPVGPAAGFNYQKARVVTTFVDFSPQRQARLDESANDRNRNADLPFVLVRCDRECNITFANPAATQLTGYTPDELMQPGFWRSVLHADDVPAFDRAMASVWQGNSARFEARLHRKDGSLTTVQAFLHANWSNDEVVGATFLMVKQVI